VGIRKRIEEMLELQAGAIEARPIVIEALLSD